MYSVIIIILVLLILILILVKGRDVLVRSTVDGREYMVRNENDKQNAADMLATICSKLNKFVEILKKEYSSDARVRKIALNFKCSNIREGDGAFGYTSYTENKGDVTLCMRDKETDALHEESLLMFVSLHEMAHVMSESYGHNDEFKKNFIWLIEEAESRGFYHHKDFNANPEDYCGIKVNATPH